jgi:hypothetical protein
MKKEFQGPFLYRPKRPLANKWSERNPDAMIENDSKYKTLQNTY